jgi:hypothetical protein
MGRFSLAICLMAVSGFTLAGPNGTLDGDPGEGPQGADIPITPGAGWSATVVVPPAFFWSSGEPVFADDGPFTFEGSFCVFITDDFSKGDQFTIYDNDVALGSTSAVAEVVADEVGPDAAFADPTYSSGVFPVGPGSHSITIQIINNPFDGGRAYIKVEDCPAGVGGNRTTFVVTKDFTDDNPGEIEVTISCNTGLPLEQSKDISEGAGVEFVVTEFDAGELDCEITEDGATGYDAEYFDGLTTNSTGCEYEDLQVGLELECTITNTPAPVDVVIHKDWVIEGSSDADGVSQEYRIDLRCDSEIIGGNDYGDIWHIFWFDEGDATFVAEVIPDFPSTTCWVEEEVFDSAVEVDNGCGQFEVSVNNGHECTITNTVFFEGIPTLNQYGLAILALLMLGVGFVGFRRLA